MKRNKRARRVKVSADGAGVVSHAGVGLLRELAEDTGLVDAVTEALIDTYRGVPVHAPGRVFTDLAAAVEEIDLIELDVHWDAGRSQGADRRQPGAGPQSGAQAPGVGTCGGVGARRANGADPGLLLDDP